MLRLITVTALLMLTSTAFAQSFPDAQKQPRQKEMKSQHRKFRRAAHRRHIRRGTVSIPVNNSNYYETAFFIAAEEKYIIACHIA